MAGRRKARILAFQALYAWEQSGGDVGDVLDFCWLSDAKKERLGEEGFAFVRLVISGVIENIAVIDAAISQHLTNWDISRLQKVDLSILRMSVYTLLYQRDVPPSIVIDEAIEISREFGSPDSYRFINAVLDAVRRSGGAAAGEMSSET